ncbi:AraC family transcriptional regulator ligand-binding domain-containing protein [Sphingobium sp. HBC34]|uniref:AraC family transcriptional regulator ligand-binding domain-containing protein n=1 Tax=Sphingobium cyanobacteriorum TaxID=3063954 RepID=A0ABT8ZN53_9SPHN|nr:AraC family transcriptional regulator [Sphingobium sp. HBC34]MDO7835553.1 AraC family transcriptional regulator ligand-binding domain-containing protein [Sphingobium sp. HBC34]
MDKETVSLPHDGRGGEEQATIRLLFLNAFFNALPDVADGRMEPLLREHGFFRSQLGTPYERAPLHRYIALVENASEKLNRPFLGLEMGTRFGLPDLGPFHALLRAAGTLRSALESMARFQSRWQTRTMLDMTVDADCTTYSYRIEDPKIWPRRQDAEFAVAGIVTIVRQLTSARWFPVEAHFEHSIVGREERLAQFFRSRVMGSQVANKLVILNKDLDRPFVSAAPQEDSKLKSILECHLLDLMGPESMTMKSFVAQAEDVIMRRLGRTHVDCDSVAAELNLSGRSFRRRLMEEGTSFRNLLQRARQIRARVILEAPDVPLSVAAEQLGYSDTATFSRAFKDWTGVSPGRFARKPD